MPIVMSSGSTYLPATAGPVTFSIVASMALSGEMIATPRSSSDITGELIGIASVGSILAETGVSLQTETAVDLLV